MIEQEQLIQALKLNGVDSNSSISSVSTVLDLFHYNEEEKLKTLTYLKTQGWLLSDVIDISASATASVAPFTETIPVATNTQIVPESELVAPIITPVAPTPVSAPVPTGHPSACSGPAGCRGSTGRKSRDREGSGYPGVVDPARGSAR